MVNNDILLSDVIIIPPITYFYFYYFYNRMSSGKPYHFRSGEKISKNTFGFPRKSADRDHNDPVIPIRYTADH